MNRPLHSLLPIATALALSVCGGFVFRLLHIPLPWMLGPMSVVGVAGIRGVRVGALRGGRQAGQVVIGCALGLYFSGEGIATLVLATAPGGLSEMCITAKILGLGVPLVTSFQVARLAIVVTCSLPTWRLLQAVRSRR